MLQCVYAFVNHRGDDVSGMSGFTSHGLNDTKKANKAFECDSSKHFNHKPKIWKNDIRVFPRRGSTFVYERGMTRDRPSALLAVRPLE
jgi:hypothetical protein